MYLSETSQMDWEIGQLLAAIDASDSMDNTIVAYCTDHGPSMHRAKFSLYDWGTHSSFIFRGPRIAGSGRVDKGLASTIDVAPTLMNLAGGSAPASCQGQKSALPIKVKTVGNMSIPNITNAMNYELFAVNVSNSSTT